MPKSNCLLNFGTALSLEDDGVKSRLAWRFPLGPTLIKLDPREYPEGYGKLILLKAVIHDRAIA